MALRPVSDPALLEQLNGVPAGQRTPGNIDLHNRPVVRNPDGSFSTVKTIGIGTDAGEVVIPTISDDGRTLSNEEAIDLYRRTGKNFGTFDTTDNATKFAQSLHEQQAQEYGGRRPVRDPAILARLNAPEPEKKTDWLRQAALLGRNVGEGVVGTFAAPN